MTIGLGILLIAMALHVAWHTLREELWSLSLEDIRKLELAYVTFWTGWLALMVGVGRLARMR